MNEVTIRMHSFLDRSLANGPGSRAVIWFQGCSLGCPGCFNPQTHSPLRGQQVTVGEMVQRITDLGHSIEGITISGGEPLQQLSALTELLRSLRQETPLSVLLFSGYTLPEIETMPESDALIACVDVLIAGRFHSFERVAEGLIGSANQTVHLLTDRYTREDLDQRVPSEIVISAQGDLVISGIDPLKW